MHVIKSKSNWATLSKCTGKGFENRHNPCNYNIILEENDIVKMIYIDDDGQTKIMYGFICINCNCFTKINPMLIPSSVFRKCPTIAKKGSAFYKDLSIEEQILSDKI